MPPLSRTVASGPMAAVLLGLKHLVVSGMRGRRRVKFRPVLCPPQVGFADPPRVLLSRLCSGASFVQYSFNRRVFQPSRHQGSIPLLSLGLGPHIRTLRPAFCSMRFSQCCGISARRPLVSAASDTSVMRSQAKLLSQAASVGIEHVPWT